MCESRKEDKPSVLVLMASYNGGKFISEQIESILNQNDVEVSLHICDDGSNDETVDICCEYAKKFNNVSFSINHENKGLSKNFMDMVLSENADGFEYYAFSDQDDYWLPNKLIRAIDKLEEQVDGNPGLYYSDVENVDCNLEGGFREYSRWKSCNQELIAVLTVNWASGCTMVFNDQLRSVLLEYIPPSFPRIHDSWLHLVAFVSGVIVPDLENSFIKRRLTGGNQVGLRDLESVESISSTIKKWKKLATNSIHSQAEAASYLLNGYGQSLSARDYKLIQLFASMPHSLKARIAISRKLFLCPFPTRSMACSFSLKALMNRL